MTAFRVLLIVFFALLLIYTSVVVMEYGLNFVPFALRDARAMEWPGQFDVDFLMMLTLSGLWVAWRHQFTATGLLLGLLAFLGGASFQCVYLFVVSLQAKGDMREVLLGKSRAQS